MHFVRIGVSGELAMLNIHRNHFSTFFSDILPGIAPVLVEEGGAKRCDSEQQEWAGLRGRTWGW